MSGGSYEYLFLNEAATTLTNMDHLESMANRLTELGFEDAALETEEVLLACRHFIRRYNARRERLAPVWKAVEWKDSGDTGIKEVEDAIKKYRGDLP
jgi:hypothetical protein